MNSSATNALRNVGFIVLQRHPRVNPGTEAVDIAAAQKNDRVCQKIIQMIPVEDRDQPQKILAVVSPKPRSRQGARPFAVELHISPIEVPYMIGPGQFNLAPQLAAIILGQATPQTRLIIVTGHEPQIPRLPKELVPHICPHVMPSLNPGEAYLIDIANGTCEHITTDIAE